MKRAGLSTVRFRVVVGDLASSAFSYPAAMEIARRARARTPSDEVAWTIRVEAVVE